MLPSTPLLFGLLSAGTSGVLGWPSSQMLAGSPELGRRSDDGPPAAMTVPTSEKDDAPPSTNAAQSPAPSVPPTSGNTTPDQKPAGDGTKPPGTPTDQKTANLPEPPFDGKPAPLQGINHDKVLAFPKAISPGVLGTMEERFQPTLWIGKSCEPYALVGQDGKISNGLKASGSPDGDCRPNNKQKNPGQTIVRHASYEGRDAFMYCSYFPKVNQLKVRHYVSCNTIWLDRISCAKPNDIQSFRIAAVYGTQGFNYSKPMPNPPLMKLADNTGDWTHASLLQDGGETKEYYGAATSTGPWQLVSWSQLTDAAKNALWNFRFGDEKNKDLRIPLAWKQTFENTLKEQYRGEIFTGPKCGTVTDDEDASAASSNDRPAEEAPAGDQAPKQDSDKHPATASSTEITETPGVTDQKASSQYPKGTTTLSPSTHRTDDTISSTLDGDEDQYPGNMRSSLGSQNSLQNTGGTGHPASQDNVRGVQQQSLAGGMGTNGESPSEFES